MDRLGMILDLMTRRTADPARPGSEPAADQLEAEIREREAAGVAENGGVTSLISAADTGLGSKEAHDQRS